MARKTRDSDTGQLDLFLTESEPAPAESSPPRLVIEPPPPPNPEPPTPIESDMPPENPIPPEINYSPADPILPSEPVPDLPPPPDDPPEVAADIRAMFLEEEERQRAEETITIREGKPPLVTGIYRKPRPTAPKPLVLPLADPLRPTPPQPQPKRPTPPPDGRPSADHRPSPTPPPSPRPSTPRPSPLTALRSYLSAAPLGPKALLALLASILLVALLAWWSGRPTPPSPTPAPTLASTDLPSDLPPSSPEVPRPAGDGGDTPAPAPLPEGGGAPAPGGDPAQPPATALATAVPSAPAQSLRIPGATVTLTGDGAWLVQYTDAVFVSSDKISVEGMKALKATAAALLKLPGDVKVTIHGHTDDIPPPPDATGPYRTNADLATARATVAQEHLTVFCKRQSRFTFEVAAPSTTPAPYPNDTPAHRRLNRTITLRITPSSLTPT